MTPDELRSAIRAVLANHPRVSPSPAGHATHAERYLTNLGSPIGFEPKRVRFQNLWVRADSLRLDFLADIPLRVYRHSEFKKSKPNHNLFGEPAFKDGDLVCFKVSTLGEAQRVIDELTGHPGKP
jgi:hypothetical protein